MKSGIVKGTLNKPEFETEETAEEPVPKQIKVDNKTHERLGKLVEFKGETYDQIINKCIDAFEEKKRRRG